MTKPNYPALDEANRRAAKTIRNATEHLLSTTERALIILYDHAGNYGMAASELGPRLWPNRSGRIVSTNGGGDYGAQMLLGRLRKAGLARTLNTEGSSRWALTSEGLKRVRAMREVE